EVLDTVATEEVPWEHKPNSMMFVLPGLTALVYKWTPAPARKRRKAGKAPKAKEKTVQLSPATKKKATPEAVATNAEARAEKKAKNAPKQRVPERKLRPADTGAAVAKKPKGAP